jgi:hypothetical protein
MNFKPYAGYAIKRRPRGYQLGFAAVKGGREVAWSKSISELRAKVDGLLLVAATAGEKMITPSAATGPNMAGDLSYGD